MSHLELLQLETTREIAALLISVSIAVLWVLAMTGR
jgi:hypothetical protein